MNMVLQAMDTEYSELEILYTGQR